MDPFDYLSVLTSIILALGITRLPSGVGRLLQERSRTRLYWIQLLRTLNVLLCLALKGWDHFSAHGVAYVLAILLLVVLHRERSPLATRVLQSKPILLHTAPVVRSPGLTGYGSLESNKSNHGILRPVPDVNNRTSPLLDSYQPTRITLAKDLLPATGNPFVAYTCPGGSASGSAP